MPAVESEISKEENASPMQCRNGSQFWKGVNKVKRNFKWGGDP